MHHISISLCPLPVSDGCEQALKQHLGPLHRLPFSKCIHHSNCIDRPRHLIIPVLGKVQIHPTYFYHLHVVENKIIKNFKIVSSLDLSSCDRQGDHQHFLKRSLQPVSFSLISCDGHNTNNCITHVHK